MAPSMLTTLLFVLSALLVTSTDAASFSWAPRETPNEPCILLDVDFNITMKLLEGGTEVATAVRTDDDPGISLQGSCGFQSILILRFTNGTNWTFIFTRNTEGIVSLDRLIQFSPSQIFGSATTYSDFVSFDDPGIAVLSDDNSSYSCVSTQETEYEPTGTPPQNITFTLVSIDSNIRAQGFNVRNGQFSPPSSCSADLSTTPSTTPVTSGPSDSTSQQSSPTTTAAPSSPPISSSPSSSPASSAESSSTPAPTTTTTTMAPLPPVNNYTVQGDNGTCIVLLGALELGVTYEANSTTGLEMKTLTFEVPADATWDGDCRATSTSQELGVTFNNGWSLKFTFSTDSEVQGLMGSVGQGLTSQEDISYRISNITLTYVINSTNFPGATVPEGTVITAAPSVGEADFPSKAGDTGYYQCNSTVTLTISDDVILTTRFLEFKAFNTDDDAGFAGSPNVCYSDDDSDATVPIIVGCVLGGLVLVVVIFFFACRYKKKSSYQEI